MYFESNDVAYKAACQKLKTTGVNFLGTLHQEK